METTLRASYKPDGLNLGMNLAAPRVRASLGICICTRLPRWMGDSNFMTVACETRVHPEI